MSSAIRYIMAIKYISFSNAVNSKKGLLSENAPEQIKSGKDWRMISGSDPNQKHPDSDRLVAALKAYHQSLSTINSILKW